MKKFLIGIFILLLVIIGGVILWFLFSDHRTINSKTELLGLLGIDFTDIEITDIEYQNFYKDSYTRIVVFYNDSDEALQSREYYNNSIGAGLSDSDLSCIPPGHISDMKELGINSDSIRGHGGNYKDFITGQGEQRPYEIHWYELDKSYGYKGNVLIFTLINGTIKLNVEKILKN